MIKAFIQGSLEHFEEKKKLWAVICLLHHGHTVQCDRPGCVEAERLQNSGYKIFIFS